METLSQLEAISKHEARVAMATLVATRGTTPKKEGAKMWVGAGGRILGSVTIGGCVDGRVLREAEEVLATSRPRLLSLSLGDEDAWDLGLSCGGTLDVFIEPVDLSGTASAAWRAYQRVRAEREAGRSAVVAVALDEGAARLVVFQDGAVEGTLGDPALDEEARRRALELMRQGSSRTLRLERGAAPLDVFFEVHAPPPVAVVFGAGDISMPVVRFAKALGFRTIVVDGRPRFATRERFPDADEIRVGVPSAIAEEIAYTPSTFVIVTVHDYRSELPVLRVVLRGDPAYVGLLGNRRRGRALLDVLAEQGVPREALDRVRVPIGLDIGATTAEEIALSILAEVVAVRNGRPGGPMRDRAS